MYGLSKRFMSNRNGLSLTIRYHDEIHYYMWMLYASHNITYTMHHHHHHTFETVVRLLACGLWVVIGPCTPLPYTMRQNKIKIYYPCRLQFGEYRASDDDDFWKEQIIVCTLPLESSVAITFLHMKCQFLGWISINTHFETLIRSMFDRNT